MAGQKIIKQMTNNLAGVPSIVFEEALECHYL
jgi:ABC-type phosphate transport system permease subunit